MRGRTILGALLVVVGGLLLLEQAGVADAGELIATWWPLALIGVGLWGMVTTSWTNLGSLILVGLGAVFLGQTLGVVSEDAWELVWPVVLVAAGVWLLAGRSRRRGADRSTGGARLDAVAILSGRNERVTAADWEGGEITAVLGGAELHLGEAVPVESGAVLEATAIMGGVEIYVPTHWDVEVSATPILGGVDDSRSPRRRDHEGPRPRLHVRAVAIMGGVEISDEVAGPGAQP